LSGGLPWLPVSGGLPWLPESAFSGLPLP